MNELPMTETLGQTSQFHVVEAPEWMRHNGKMVNFMHLRDTNNGELNFLCPSGIGDVAWIVSKYWKLAQERDCLFYFPDAGQFNRVQPYMDLMGLKSDLTNIDIRELLEYPGEFEEKDFANGGSFYVHANRHIEAGKKLVDWHPWLPFRNPAPPIYVDSNAGRNISNDKVWVYPDGLKPKPYLLVHMASATYCEGNWFPRIWARMIQWIEDNVMPVSLVGAKWDEAMIEQVCDIYRPHGKIVTRASLAKALTWVVNSAGMIGVDSGLSILATYYGLPCLRAYPHWLKDMPGTWECPLTLHPRNKWCFMDELYDEYKPWCEKLKEICFKPQ